MTRFQLTSTFSICILGYALSACSIVNKVTNGGPPSTPVPPATLYSTASVTNGWVPALTSPGSQKGTVTVTTSTFSKPNSHMVRLDQGWNGNEILVDLGVFNAATQFGLNGSITLSAQTDNYPRSGGAYPVLTSFYVVDNGSVTHEYVNLTAGCGTSGMYVCNSGSCYNQASCSPQAPSGFTNRMDWEQHQTSSYGYSSVNSFPRCDNGVAGWGTCPASLSTLPSGHYYAKYALLSDSGGSVAGVTATLKVTMTVKKDTNARSTGGTNGAVDLNVVLVGDNNVNDSHTAVGQQNLNLLFSEVNSVLTANVGVGIHNIHVYEWRNADGGDRFSQVDFLSGLGVMFAAGSASPAFSATDEGNRINIFLVSSIDYPGASFTILGLSGGILGPPTNGTQISGLAFSSFDQLTTFNSSCAVGVCPRNSQDPDFLEMGSTIAHELGHYLGLNHPSEKGDAGSQQHDQLPDTPQCTSRYKGLDTSGNPIYVLDQRACYTDAGNTLGGQTCQQACDAAAGGQYFTGANAGSTPNNFCPATQACQFNHLMWYTTKNRKKVAGAWQEDGNLISTQSSALVQWDSFVR